jgi:hypothetical protein
VFVSAKHETACKTLTTMKPAPLQSMHDAGNNKDRIRGVCGYKMLVLVFVLHDLEKL